MKGTFAAVFPPAQPGWRRWVCLSFGKTYEHALAEAMRFVGGINGIGIVSVDTGRLVWLNGEKIHKPFEIEAD